MTIIGNHSTSQAVLVPIPGGGEISLVVTAPFDGHLVSLSAYLVTGTPPGALEFDPGGISAFPVMPTAGVPTTVTGVQPASIVPDVATGSPVSLTILQTVPKGIAQILASGSSSSDYDIWADFEPIANVPFQPNFGTTEAWRATVLDMASWNLSVFVGLANQGFVVSSFHIERSVDGGSTWTTVYTVLGLGDLRGRTINFQDTVPAGPLRYRAFNTNTAGSSTSSSVQIAAAPSGITTPVLVPQTATRWIINYAGGVDVAQYVVERSTDAGVTWVPLGTTGASTTSFVDTATPAGALLYRVIAQNSVGSTTSPNASAFNSITTQTPPPPPQPPGPPGPPPAGKVISKSMLQAVLAEVTKNPALASPSDLTILQNYLSLFP